MFVIKRDGRRESVKFDKITARIERLCYGLDANYVQPLEIAKKVIAGLYDGVSTAELDNLGSRNGCFHDDHSSGLCHTCGPYRCFQPAQNYK
jgi:hypothetical protein